MGGKGGGGGTGGKPGALVAGEVTGSSASITRWRARSTPAWSTDGLRRSAKASWTPARLQSTVAFTVGGILRPAGGVRAGHRAMPARGGAGPRPRRHRGGARLPGREPAGEGGRGGCHPPARALGRAGDRCGTRPASPPGPSQAGLSATTTAHAASPSRPWVPPFTPALPTGRAGQRTLGHVARAEGDPAEAERCLIESVLTFAAIGAHYEEARTRLDLAALHRDRGQREAGARELERGRAARRGPASATTYRREARR